jgi:hypothetical protein
MSDAKIGDFLTRLGEDPELLERYFADPDSVLADSGLNADQQATVRSEDAARIQAALMDEYPGSDVGVVYGKPILRPIKIVVLPVRDPEST